MPIEPPGPTNRPFVRVRDKKFPGLPEQAGNSVSFLSDDPLVPLPVIDLEPLPVDPEPPGDEGDPMVPHKFHIPLGLIVNIRV